MCIRDSERTVWPDQRCPVVLAISEDGGKTWPWRRIIEHGEGFIGPWNDVNNRRYEYPCLIQGKDGRIHVAYAWGYRKRIKYLCMDCLLYTSGFDNFTKLFPLCLADNGTEFSDPFGIEVDSDGVIRSRVFYCDPSSPGQKGACENNHEFIRRIIPKFTDLGQYAQAEINLMMDHICLLYTSRCV